MKINVKNTEKIQKVLNKVEKTSTLHLISPKQISETITTIENQLSSLIVVKDDMTGMTFDIQADHASKNSTQATTARIKKFKSGWFLINVRRDFSHVKICFVSRRKSKKG